MADLSKLSAEEKRELLAQLQKEERENRQEQREAYEGLRAAFMNNVRGHVEIITTDVEGFKRWLEGETAAFLDVMRDYGQLRKADQSSYTIVNGDFKLEIKSNKVKGFDERADMAAERLMEYLKKYVKQSDKGVDDPMYQLAMTLLERNKQGDLDYKSISKLYELEGKFEDEYSEIMELFRESNVVNRNAVNYYFYRRDGLGVWRRIEPSFCRI